MFKDIPMKIVVPIIVVTWILSLFSALAIVYTVPTLIGVGKGAITSDKIADEAVITAKLADGNVTSAKILNGTIIAANLADGSIITVTIVDGAVTTSKIADGNVTTDKIADGNVTNSKLAPDAIPFGCATGTSPDTTTSVHPNFVDMLDMTVNVTIQRPSTLWIMFSTMAYTEVAHYLRVRAYINNAYAASPVDYILSPYTDWMSYGCNFYYYANATSYPATFSVKIQWDVSATTTGHVWGRALAVIALPA
jgi:hypothetical protein